jgi:hypothetical protein
MKLACLKLYILMLLFFFLVGIYYAGITEAAKNKGLAGGAIVLAKAQTARHHGFPQKRVRVSYGLISSQECTRWNFLRDGMVKFKSKDWNMPEK